MTIWQNIRMGTSVIAILTGFTMIALADDHHGGYSAGEPGNAKKPSREIVVLMSETDYTPSKIEVRRGEQIRFVIRNVGSESHEFLLASIADNLKHAEAMKKNPDMDHDEPNGLKLAAKQSSETLCKFTNAGTFEYSCLIPKHHELGMIGSVILK